MRNFPVGSISRDRTRNYYGFPFEGVFPPILFKSISGRNRLRGLARNDSNPRCPLLLLFAIGNPGRPVLSVSIRSIRFFWGKVGFVRTPYLSRVGGGPRSCLEKVAPLLMWYWWPFDSTAREVEGLFRKWRKNCWTSSKIEKRWQPAKQDVNFSPVLTELGWPWKINNVTLFFSSTWIVRVAA